MKPKPTFMAVKAATNGFDLDAAKAALNDLKSQVHIALINQDEPKMIELIEQYGEERIEELTDEITALYEKAPN